MTLQSLQAQIRANTMAQQLGYYPIVERTVEFDGTLYSFDAGNVMYEYKERHFSNGKIKEYQKVFAHGRILSVEKRVFSDTDTHDYVFHILTDNPIKKKAVIIPGEMYGTAEMIFKLVEAGITFVGPRGNSTRASLIINFINHMGLLTEKIIHFHNGYTDGEYQFLTDMDADSDLLTPYFVNRLEIGKNPPTFFDAVQHVYSCRNLFGEETWLKLMCFMTYSLMHSIFSEKGYQMKKILLLCGNGAQAACKFLQVYNKSKADVTSLKNNISSINKKLYCAKDTPIIFSGNGDKIANLIDVFCNNATPEVNLNGNKLTVNANSLCVLLSDNADTLFDNNNFVRMVVSEFVDESQIDSPSFGIFVKNLIDFFINTLNSGKLDSILGCCHETASNEFDSVNEINELTILLAVYEILDLFFCKHGILIQELLSFDSHVDFFVDLICNDESDDMGMLEKIRSVLSNAVLNCDNFKFYNKKQIDVTVSADKLLILYDDKYFYIQNEQFENFVVKNVSDNVSKLSILDTLARNGWIYTNNSSHSAKLSVHISGNNSNRSSWIAVKRQFVELPFSIPMVEENTCDNMDISPILLGQDGHNKKVYIPLNHPQVNNFHIGITGDSGTGKSYATLSIIEKLSRLGISSVIIDSENSFSENTMEKAFVESMGDRLNYINVYNHKIPINIFEKQEKHIGKDVSYEKPVDTAGRVSQLLCRVCKLTDKQTNAVYGAVLNLLTKSKEHIPTLTDLYNELKDCETPEADAVKDKLIQITSANVFIEDGRTFNWDNHLNSGKCLIFSLDGFQNNCLKRMIYESILQDLWHYARSHGTKEHPFAVVIDEIEIIPPVRNSTFADLLTLGRKFGVMCIWNTTLMKGRFNDYSLSTLNQAGTRLFFKTSDPDEIRYIGHSLNKYADAPINIQKLVKGRCFVRGTFSTDSDAIHENSLFLIDIPEIKS